MIPPIAPEGQPLNFYPHPHPVIFCSFCGAAFPIFPDRVFYQMLTPYPEHVGQDYSDYACWSCLVLLRQGQLSRWTSGKLFPRCSICGTSHGYDAGGLFTSADKKRLVCASCWAIEALRTVRNVGRRLLTNFRKFF